MRTLDLASFNWSFRKGRPGSRWLPAAIPGCVHKDLLANGLIPNPFHGTNELELQWIEAEDWEYKTRFDVSETLFAEEHLQLVAEGLDTDVTVWVNGIEVGSGENMFVAHRWDLRKALKPGANELRLLFRSALRYVQTRRPEHLPPVEFNDPIGGGTRMRKQACQFGWDWAPRFVTAGVWLPLRIEAWSQTRLESVHVTQEHQRHGEVVLHLHPEWLSGARSKGLRLEACLEFKGRLVATASSTGGNLELKVQKPRLWWPAGQGEQALYTLTVRVFDPLSKALRDQWSRRIGLRTLKLDRHKDEWGESFQFLVNGRPVFAKGANWIPVHSFVAGLGRSDYERDLRAAVEANMNCVRLWGGGIYESEHFYDLCDELGLMVWNDFMFACTLYPADDDFVASVAVEAEQQIRRIRHRACLALWCGNNEVAQINPKALEDERLRGLYERLFHKLLPELVSRHDGVTDYWPSSAWGGRFGFTHEDGERNGDTHFWDVWHARKPVSDYEKWRFRFCSEFGMQSYCSTESALAFCPPDDTNLFGPSSENHQKNPFGNQIILDYVSRRYGMPGSQDALVYLSQLNQAYCMQVAVEHYRRNRPRCMGALYWQLNDCWPCASWSSIEHSGRWKALHHVARRFFAPALLSAQVEGDEKQGKGNYRESTHTGKVGLHTDYDGTKVLPASIRWKLITLDGRVLRKGGMPVRLQPGEAQLQLTLDFSRELARHGRDNLVLRHELVAGRKVLSGDSAFFAPPRFLKLLKPATDVEITRLTDRQVRLELRSQVFQHRLELNVTGLAFHASDNYFEMDAGLPKTVDLRFEQPVSDSQLKRRLKLRSLYDAQNPF